MIPWETVDTADTPDGTRLVLARRGTEWEVRADRATLMSSRAHGSEEALATLALERVPGARRVLVGGLGLGYTVRAALDRLPGDARVVVAELSPAVVEWNRTHVAGLAARPLEDPRVGVHLGDVVPHIAASRGEYDAILLDVDNSPTALVQDGNAGLYDEAGVRRCWTALRPGGVLAVWSLAPDPAYVRRLARGGFEASAALVRARERGSKRHVVFLGLRPAPARQEGVPVRPRRAAAEGRRAGGR